MTMLATLRDRLLVCGDGVDDDDFRLRSLWRVDHRSRPDARERFMTYSFVIAQTVRQGCCYADFGSVVLDERSDGLIGQDARTARGTTVEEDIAILDAAWGAVPMPTHEEVTFDGPPERKARRRAEVIVDEAVRLLDGRPGRVVNIGAMGTLIDGLGHRPGVEVLATDLDPQLVRDGLHGTPIVPGDRSPELVAASDVAVICGETLPNDTLAVLLEAARAGGTRVVVFAVTGCHFAAEYCRTFGVDVVVSEPQPQYLFQGPTTVRVFRRSALR